MIYSKKTCAHPKIWGTEYWIVNGDMYCGKIMTLNEQFRCSLHYHKLKDETFYVSKGKILMTVGWNKFVMKSGDCVHIIPRVKHSFLGLKKSEIIEFSTHHNDFDSFRDNFSCKVKDDEFKRLKDEYL